MLQNALDLMQADYEAHPGADLEEFNKIRERYKGLETSGETVSQRQSVVNGHDIMKTLNVPPGPMIKTMLQYAQDLYDGDPGIDRETILAKMQEKFNPNEDD